MDGQQWLAEQFEAQRAHLQSVAYRMLGSRTEADDAVQESWLRLSRSDASGIENLGGWLTTVVARVCLDQLRGRESRREEAAGVHVAGPGHDAGVPTDPEQDVLLADSIGSALLVVLQTLAPAERLAFVLHDMFAVPFDEIAPIVGCTSTAARQLASRARRRVQGTAAVEDGENTRRKEVVTAFLSAARSGDFEALLAVLAPDIVVRSDTTAERMGAPKELRGARAVADNFKGRARGAELALANGVPCAVWAPGGKLRALFDMTVVNGKIAELVLRADADYLAELDVEIAPR